MFMHDSKGRRWSNRQSLKLARRYASRGGDAAERLLISNAEIDANQRGQSIHRRPARSSIARARVVAA